MATRRFVAAVFLCLPLLCTLALSACSAGGNDVSREGSPDAPETSEYSDIAGDTVFLGHYEQDGDLENGPEPVEWLILDARDGKALLLSKYGLDAVAYNVEDADVTWEECTLRAWLNNDFLSTAFTEDEAAYIQLTEVSNGDDQGYADWEASGGNDTQDYVFLLSYAEVNRYLSVTYKGNSVEARVAPTVYAKQIGAYTYSGTQTQSGEPAGEWWLRSPSFLQEQGAGTAVNQHGALYGNYGMASDSVCVRPAIWIDLDSGII